MDSGASQHMTGYAAKVLNVHRCPANEVKMANGHVGAAVTQGTAHLNLESSGGLPTLTLHNVLVVPGMTVSLFSVRRAGKRGFRTEFTDTAVRIFKGSRRVLTGTFSGPLYALHQTYGTAPANAVPVPVLPQAAAASAASLHACARRGSRSPPPAGAAPLADAEAGA